MIVKMNIENIKDFESIVEMISCMGWCVAVGVLHKANNKLGFILSLLLATFTGLIIIKKLSG